MIAALASLLRSRKSSLARRSPARNRAVGSLFRRRAANAPLLCGTLLLAAACDEKPAEPAVTAEKGPASPKPASTAKPAAGNPHGMPGKLGGAGSKAPAAARKELLAWEAPAGLKQVPPKNSFRRASYEVPPGPKETAVGILNVFAFGGDVDSNVERWKGQFQNLDASSVKRTDREVNGLKQTILEIPKGDYNGGMSPEEGGKEYGMLAALIPLQEGPLYIFKMTGPAGGVAAAKDAFMAMMDSVHRSDSAPAAGAAKAAAAEKKKEPAGH